MSNAVIVPIKTNNERLPGKNTRLLKGHPLYAWLFETLRNTPVVDEVFIDSSDEHILTIAQEWDFTPLKRPVSYNENNITGDDLLMRVVDQIPHDLLALLHVTSPFLSSNAITQGFELLKANDLLDSVFGVLAIHNRLWYQEQPVNHNINELKRTQDLTPVYEETDVYFMRKASLKEFKKRICSQYQYFEMSKVESTDLDDLSDFVRAEAYIDAGLVSHVFAKPPMMVS